MRRDTVLQASVGVAIAAALVIAPLVRSTFRRAYGTGPTPKDVIHDKVKAAVAIKTERRFAREYGVAAEDPKAS